MGLFIRKSIEALQAEAKETGSGTLKRVQLEVVPLNEYWVLSAW